MVNRFLVVFLLCAVLVSGTVWACGPYFPQAYFAFGDEASIIDMPEASFRYQVYRLLGVTALPEEVNPEYVERPSQEERTLDVDAADLAEALRYANVPEQEAADRAAAYRAARMMLPAMQQMETEFDGLYSDQDAAGGGTSGAPEQADAETALRAALDDAPREFKLYAEAAARYRYGDNDGAIRLWKELLELPREDRVYRSTWAAYMIGRASIPSEESSAYFEQTRELAKGNFKDSLGLAGDSLGWQGYSELMAGNITAAIRHYSAQLALPDTTQRSSAEISLRRCCNKALETRESLVQVAGDELGRRIMTAWIVSHPSSHDAATLWLEVAGASGEAGAFPDADLLAWSAYDLGDYARAAAWLARPSADTPYGDWVRSKLLLRDGKIDEAVALLGALSKTFPQTTEWTLFPGYDEYNANANTDPRKVVQAELGVLLLGRSEYVDAFDLLLRAGYWLDAAYIAERVLSEDELRAYVDAHSADPELTNAVNVGYWYEGTVVQHLRYTLARRLARAGKWTDAISYLPPEHQQFANAFLAEMNKVPAEAEPFLKPNLWEWFTGAKPERDVNREYAQHLFAAGEIARTRGMELLGTEVEPDWHVFDGNFELPGAESNRLASVPVHPSDIETEPDESADPPLNAALAHVLTASKDERARAQNHAPNPNRRYHYRYVAAELMWQSAQWLPNDDMETMRALYTGGMYLQGRDPVAANKFYRALVWRNPNMAFAQQADRLRWFPASFPE